MNTFLEALDVFGHGLLDSTRWLRITNILCVLGMAIAALSALQHRKLMRAGAEPRMTGGARALLGLLTLACLTGIVSVSWRWIEVNHFPSQTMSEVLVMFSLGLLVCSVALHFAMGLYRDGHGWAILDDALKLLVLGVTLAVNIYQTSLSTAQRDLPPALQSYWFPWHLSALMIGYATLTIAAVLCMTWFGVRFWTGLRAGEGKRMGMQIAVLAGLVLTWVAAGFGLDAALAGVENHVTRLTTIVVSQLVVIVATMKLVQVKLGGVFSGGGPTALFMILLTIAVTPLMGKAGLYVLGSVGLVMLLTSIALLEFRGGDMAARLARIEKSMELTSFKAFSVGMPFLTAGLWMGAFWAQEAWANYWGWDSKENTALITWLVYVVYVHLRMLGGYRGQRAMGVLLAGALAILITFQLFGFLPDSQKSLHRYTDDGVEPREGQIEIRADQSARVDESE